MIEGHFTINDIVKRVGRNKTTVLRWEEQGLIPVAQRDARGWRYYTQKDFDHIVSLVEKTDYFRNVSSKQRHNGILDTSRHIERIREAVARQGERVEAWKLHAQVMNAQTSTSEDWQI